MPLHEPAGLGSLPCELLTRIFILAQNPCLATVSTQFWHLSTLSTVRARYLAYRFGHAAVLGERAMSYKIASIHVIDHLLKMKCDPRADSDWLYWKACEQQDTQLCTMLLDAIQPTRITANQWLNIAAMKGATVIIDRLIVHYHADVHFPNGEDLALVIACAENQVNVARHLITRYGCDAHRHQERQLRRACLFGHLDLVKLLLPGANVHAYNDAALQNAAHKGHAEIVDLLLRAGAHATVHGDAPIQYAVASQDEVTVRHLLQAGADPRCNHDWPIRLACRRGTTAVIRLLLDAGVDPNTKKGMPLREALRSGVEDAVALLLAHHADPNSLGARRGLHEAVQRNELVLISIMANKGARLNCPELLQCVMADNPRIHKATRDLILQWCLDTTVTLPS